MKITKQQLRQIIKESVADMYALGKGSNMADLMAQREKEERKLKGQAESDGWADFNAETFGTEEPHEEKADHWEKFKGGIYLDDYDLGWQNAQIEHDLTLENKIKITKEQLKQIIKEELENVLIEEINNAKIINIRNLKHLAEEIKKLGEPAGIYADLSGTHLDVLSAADVHQKASGEWEVDAAALKSGGTLLRTGLNTVNPQNRLEWKKALMGLGIPEINIKVGWAP